MKNSYAQLAIALVLLLAVFGAYGMWYHELSSVSDDVGTLTSEVALKNLDAAQAASAEKELTKLSTEEGAIEGYFVPSSDVVSFLEDTEGIGTATGAKVSVVSVNANPTPRPHLDLSLKIVGSFDAVLRTVGAIEYGPQDVRTSTLTLDSVPDDKAPTWTATMAVKVGTTSTSPKAPTPSTTATTTP